MSSVVRVVPIRHRHVNDISVFYAAAFHPRAPRWLGRLVAAIMLHYSAHTGRGFVAEDTTTLRAVGAVMVDPRPLRPGRDPLLAALLVPLTVVAGAIAWVLHTPALWASTIFCGLLAVTFAALIGRHGITGLAAAAALRGYDTTGMGSAHGLVVHPTWRRDRYDGPPVADQLIAAVSRWASCAGVTAVMLAARSPATVELYRRHGASTLVTIGGPGRDVTIMVAPLKCHTRSAASAS